MSENPTYQRGRFKHYIRYAALIMLLVADAGILSSFVRGTFLVNREITLQFLMSDAVLLGLFFVLNATVMPSIVLEADRVEVLEDGLRVRTLLYSCRIPWSDIKKLVAPFYLKFSILRTPRFFLLLNKRDLPKYDELIKTIQERAVEAPK